jgi:hypothetical protein
VEAERHTMEIQLEGFFKMIEHLLELLASMNILFADLCKPAELFIMI